MKPLLLSLSISIALYSCAQQKLGMEKIWAFSQLRTVGNIPVEEPGNGPDTVDYIYIETGPEAPNWQKAYKNGKVYTVSPSLIDPTPYSVGKNKTNGRDISLAIRKGNTLWQIVFTPSEDQHIPMPVRKAKQTDIILEGTYKGKLFRQTISNQVELLPFESV